MAFNEKNFHLGIKALVAVVGAGFAIKQFADSVKQGKKKRNKR